MSEVIVFAGCAFRTTPAGLVDTKEGDPVDSRDNAGKLDALVGPDLLANIAGFTPTTRAGRMAPLLAKIQQAPVREPHRHRHRAGQPGAR